MEDRKEDIQPAPLKRNEGLQPLSRDHHDGLLLCWKIRQALSKGIETKRIMSYVKHMFRKALQPHFEIEEQLVLSLLPPGDQMREKVISDHHEISRLVADRGDIEEIVRRFEKLLSEHIRFEERVVFQHIQKFASAEQLHHIAEMHKGKHRETWKDKFWE